jgi:fucose permease
VFSNYLPRVPEVRERLDVDNAVLGLAFVGGGLGGLLGSTLLPLAMRRLGTRRTVLLGATCVSLGLPLLAVVPTPFALFLTLVGMGCFDVFADLAMNAHGVAVQQRIGRSIMNRLHGMWSLGSLTGAVVGSSVAAAGVSMRVHLTGTALVLVAAALLATRWFLPEPVVRATSDHHGQTGDDAKVGWRALRQRVLLIVAGASIGAGVIELMGSDWASIAMRDLFDLGDGAVGIGGIAFAGSMLAGRMVGDHVLDRIGQHRLLGAALVLVSAGVALVALAPVWPVAVAGYLAWGLGTSVLFPQIYAMAGTLPRTAPAVGLAAMVFGQRFGFLLMPVGVGALS